MNKQEKDREQPTPMWRQNLEAMIFYGMPTGFFFRQGLILQSEGNGLGMPMTVIAFIFGVLFVFPLRPFRQPLLAVAAGMGIADLVQLIGS